jgi:hypothetical protein
MHGRGSCGAIVRVTVALGWQDGRLAIDFLDDGQPFDPLGLPALDLDAAAEERTIGGLGVHMFRSLVEGARYRREGGRNHLHWCDIPGRLRATSHRDELPKAVAAAEVPFNTATPHLVLF